MVMLELAGAGTLQGAPETTLTPKVALVGTPHLQFNSPVRRSPHTWSYVQAGKVQRARTDRKSCPLDIRFSAHLRYFLKPGPGDVPIHHSILQMGKTEAWAREVSCTRLQLVRGRMAFELRSL